MNYIAFSKSPSIYIMQIADCNMQDDGAPIAVGFGIFDNNDKPLKACGINIDGFQPMKM